MMYSMRNIEDGQTITLTNATGGTTDGSQEFCVGLTLDETIVCSVRRENRTASGGGDAASSMDSQHIVVPLVMVTVWKNSGVTVCPASRDLRCRLNGEDVEKESNIIPGNQIEVADKTLELLEGPAPEKPRPHRRHLPPTPGRPILPAPPPKPQRRPQPKDVAPPPILLPPRQPILSKEDSLKEEMKDWCEDQFPDSECELLNQVKDPDQLACLSSSYLIRHINVHTDISMTTDLADRVAKMLQEVASHRKEILRKFLTDVVSDIAMEQDPQQKTAMKRLLCFNSSAKGIQHSTVTTLLVEILRQFLDPQFIVILCLQILRALSHVPGNVVTLVKGQTISAVLGSMAVFRDEEQIQKFCLDILAKMATFVPVVLSKPPMRESSIELVVMAMTLHDFSMTVVAASIRVLANLAQSLHSLAFNAMIGSPNTELRVYVAGVLDVLYFLYQKTSHHVRSALADSGQDLNIKMDGRRFLFEYGKMDQLRCQHQLWEVQPDSPITHHHHPQNPQSPSPPPIPRRHHHKGMKSNKQINNADKDYHEDDSRTVSGDEEGEDYDQHDNDNKDSNGILKKSRSFENLRTPDRKVFFKSQNEEDELTSSSSSSSSHSSLDYKKEAKHDGRSDSPDIQILSRSRIFPTTLSPILSQSGEGNSSTETITSTPNTSTNKQAQQKQFSSPSPTSAKPHTVTTPPTPTAPVIRRQIQAPLVHINSQSDSEAETTSSVLDSPSFSSTSNKDFQKLGQETTRDDPDVRYAEINNLEPNEGSDSSDRISDNSINSSSSSTIQLPTCPNPQHHHHNHHTPHHHNHHKHIHNSNHYRLPSPTPVDLEGFPYLSADVLYMKRVMSVQITCHVCSASIKGSNPPALKLIDLPLCDLLQRPGLPKAVCQFAQSQFDPKATLMDIDPAIVIAIIDGVRYKMLAFELLRKTLHALLQRLSPTSVHHKIVLVVGELLQTVAIDPSLSPIVEDSEFVRQLHAELETLKSNGLDPEVSSHLWECLQPVADLTSKDETLTKE